MNKIELLHKIMKNPMWKLEKGTEGFDKLLSCTNVSKDKLSWEEYKELFREWVRAKNNPFMGL